jgi:hypothetical protein
LFSSTKRKNTSGEQLVDIIITQTNLLSGVIFCGGGFFSTIKAVQRNPLIYYPLLGQVKTIYV